MFQSPLLSIAKISDLQNLSEKYHQKPPEKYRQKNTVKKNIVFHALIQDQYQITMELTGK